MHPTAGLLMIMHHVVDVIVHEAAHGCLVHATFLLCYTALSLNANITQIG